MRNQGIKAKIIILFLFLSIPSLVLAGGDGGICAHCGASGDANCNAGLRCEQGFFGASYCVTPGGACFPNPLTSPELADLFDNLLSFALAIITPLAILWTMYTGFKLMFSEGKPEAWLEARNRLLKIFAAMALIIGAKAILSIISNIVGF